MKVLLTGPSDNWNIYHIVDAIENSCFELTEIFTFPGGGINHQVTKLATELDIPLTIFKSEDASSKQLLRLKSSMQVIKHIDKAIVIWDGVSSSLKYLITLARQNRIPVYVHRIDK